MPDRHETTSAAETERWVRMLGGDWPRAMLCW